MSGMQSDDARDNALGDDPPFMLTLKAIAAWLVLLACAVANGALREAILVPAFGARVSLAASGVLLSCVVIAIAIVAVPRLGPLSNWKCVYVGVLWLGLTVGFEFGFGRLVRHQSWPRLLEAYTLRDGNLWPVVLVVILVAPLLAVRFRGLA